MKYLYFLLILLFPLFSSAQDSFFTQAYSNPLQLNPSFAGSIGCSRVVLNNRQQFPLSDANYMTSTLSYDKHFNALHGGLGFTYLRDQASGGYYMAPIYSTSELSFIYSPAFIIKKKLSIKPSIQASYFRKYLDWSQLTFDDMIDRRAGFVYNTLETKMFDIQRGFDLSSGILINTLKWNLGFAMYHINQPNEGQLSPSPLNRKISVNAAYTFSKNDSANFACSPSIVFLKQGAHQLLMGSVSFKYKWLRWGVGMRSNGDKLVMIGTTLKRFTLNYSYDIASSKIPNTGGSHEVSITCLFKYKKKVKVTEQVKDEQNPQETKEIQKKVVELIKYNVIPLKPVAF